VGKNPPSAPLAADRATLHAAALARSHPSDPGHRACIPCIGMVVLKGSFGCHKIEDSNVAAFENYTMPAPEFSYI
jgi:hypothetical protein